MYELYIPLALALILLAMLSWFLIRRSRFLKKHLFESRNSRNHFYRAAIKELQNAETAEKPNRLYKISRQFFKEWLDIKKEVSDEEILELLKKYRLPFYNFLKPISDARYSGQPLSPERVDTLIEQFEYIISKNKIRFKPEHAMPENTPEKM